MKKENAVDCLYAFAGLATVTACVYAVAAVGWITGKLAKLVGLLPFESESCSGFPHRSCVTTVNNGPETFMGFIGWGVLGLLAVLLATGVAAGCYFILSAIGENVVKCFRRDDDQ